jgi:hypothetical protein
MFSLHVLHLLTEQRKLIVQMAVLIRLYVRDPRIVEYAADEHGQDRHDQRNHLSVCQPPLFYLLAQVRIVFKYQPLGGNVPAKLANLRKVA